MSPATAGQVAAAMAGLAGRADPPVSLGMVLGSGLGDLADQVRAPTVIPYDDIPGMPVSTAPGHAGRLVIGELFGKRIALMQGRLHLYEGWTPQQVALPIYLLRRLGAETLVVTNASGALNPGFGPGEVMLIEDHLNFTGSNPLTGPNVDAGGLRFPDMSRAYDPHLLTLAAETAEAAAIRLHRGVYVGVAGPSLETSAERRFFRNAGGDAVGMSTVIEVIAAVHAGFRILALSGITNAATGGPEQQPDTIEDVLKNAAISGTQISALLERLIPQL
jgi:purine-nucleoside phosphorylase